MDPELSRLLAILAARLVAARTLDELSTIQAILDDFAGGIDPRETGVMRTKDEVNVA